MEKHFNTTGPCNPVQHYMLDAVARVEGVETPIRQGKYFVIHAARQTGKTTLLQCLAKELNTAGDYHAVYMSLEGLQGVADPKEGIPAIADLMRFELVRAGIIQADFFTKLGDHTHFTNVLVHQLTEVCRELKKPLVIFFDEADCLSEGTLITFLRQLRSGHNSRVNFPFVHSVALVGMRNLRDFKARIRPDNDTLGSASPFNIIAESLTIPNFTRKDIAVLYAQHTQATGQVFEEAAVDLVFEQTCGQPWLVNAIAREVVEKMLANDPTKPATAALAADAIQAIILRRDTHIDSLMERLKEPRVRSIIEPMILGESEFDRLSDDFFLVRDLGLIKVAQGSVVPANPIYAEVIIRLLNEDAQRRFANEKPKAELPFYIQNNRIDMTALLREFQIFWRENSGIWKDFYGYAEAFPHLLLQAFLQRVVNGGGVIHREMASGTRRVDLCVAYQGVKYPVELKVDRGPQTKKEGLSQIAGYMDTLGCDEGWLCLFSTNKDAPWKERHFVKKHSVGGKTVTVVGI
jgi:hypothetical protein